MAEDRYSIWSWIATVDHKRIGIMYGITAFTFFLTGGVEALLLRIQLAQPNSTFLDPDQFNRLFTMHGTTMIFLVVMPLSAAFFNLVIPLMIGARDVAFPRLNSFSFWAFLAGGIFLNASFFIRGNIFQGDIGAIVHASSRVVFPCVCLGMSLSLRRRKRISMSTVPPRMAIMIASAGHIAMRNRSFCLSATSPFVSNVF